MANTTAAQPQLNQFTPMAYLEPELAFQTTISAYMFVACCGIMIWDILDNLKNDYMLLRSYRIKLPTVVYFISRFGSLGFILSSTIGHTAPIGSCNRFERVKAGFYTVAVASTSLLMFLRVRAIFDKSKYIVMFFSISWLAVLGTCLTVTQGRQGGEIGPTKYCITLHLKEYISSSVIAPLANDTLVFLAISWKLMRNVHIEKSVKAEFRAMILGHSMPAFSRALLKDGQAYYLTTVTSNLVTLIMLCIKPVPEAYRTMLTGPNVLIMNIMACRVFRNIRFAKFAENTMQSIVRTGGEQRNGQRMSPHSTLPVFSKSRRDTQGESMDSPGNFAINLSTNVHIERTIRVERLESLKLDDIECALKPESPKRITFLQGLPPQSMKTGASSSQGV